MADVSPALAPLAISTYGGGTTFTALWATMANNDVGLPIPASAFADRTFQVDGTFGGGTVTIEGTLDGTNYHTLTDSTGLPVTFTAAALKFITEASVQIRPKVTGGDGTTSLNVTGLFRRQPQ